MLSISDIQEDRMTYCLWFLIGDIYIVKEGHSHLYFSLSFSPLTYLLINYNTTASNFNRPSVDIIATKSTNLFSLENLSSF